jgi:hypothetical protein
MATDNKHLGTKQPTPPVRSKSELIQLHAAGPYGSLRIGFITLTRALWRHPASWFSRPRLHDRLPIILH